MEIGGGCGIGAIGKYSYSGSSLYLEPKYQFSDKFSLGLLCNMSIFMSFIYDGVDVLNYLQTLISFDFSVAYIIGSKKK